MSANVFLAPCDSPNFDETVISEVELSNHPDHPSGFSGEGAVRFWGVREGKQNRNYFEKMQSGDLVLFYQDGDYIGTGRIGTTFEDEDGWASTNFWSNAPSTLIYTIEDFSSVKVPCSRVNRIFDYVSDYNPEGLMRVAESRVSRNLAVIETAIQMYSEKHS